MTKQQFVQTVRAVGFTVRDLASRPLLDKYRVAGRLGALVNRALCAIPWLDERLAFNLTAILTKPWA
jgi:hypothetical protein